MSTNKLVFEHFYATIGVLAIRLVFKRVEWPRSCDMSHRENSNEESNDGLIPNYPIQIQNDGLLEKLLLIC